MIFDFRVASQRASDLHQAKLVADSLVDGGILWHTIERDAAPQPEIADRECLFRDFPIVVIVDSDTDPAFVAIAAALQDAGRATIVGAAPKFSGQVVTTVPLTDVPFVLTMVTSRLIRARQHREWPLMPDRLVAENKPDGSRSQGAKFPKTTKQIGQTPGVFQAPPLSRPFVVVTKLGQDDPVSALSPTNGSANKRVDRAEPVVGNQLAHSLIRQGDVAEPRVAIPSTDSVALEVARELLKSLPQRTAEFSQ